MAKARLMPACQCWWNFLHYPGGIDELVKIFEPFKSNKLVCYFRGHSTKLKKHHDYFSSHVLYDDGVFWYDLFLIISAAALKVKADRKQQEIPGHHNYYLERV